eukprot:TRINITY_DN442_c0_g1_i1.p1 TRINITY_DN442_c0_g1~~TRINITY_DN442_c0_g1_i1.p1  ORF type:complete len:197 (-),score=38.78 TRINITY_DN442_c0_g1_i1:23-613(-)
MKNGYIVMSGKEPKFAKKRNKKYLKMMRMAKVGLHENVQVTAGHRMANGFEMVENEDQTIDQVFCAAVNILQGPSGIANGRLKDSELKCRFILEAMYTGTYLAAIRNKRKHLSLTLLGGGAFGNQKDWIFETIIQVHSTYARHPDSHIEVVSISLFNDTDLWGGAFNKFQEAKIPYKFIVYKKGVAETVRESPVYT